MIDWDEIASAEETRNLRKRARELEEELELLTGLVERLGDELNTHNDNDEVHTKTCNVILYPFTLAGQRGYESPL